MKIWALKKEDVLQELKTSEKGLTEGEAKKRLRDDGENVIPQKKKSNILKFAYQLGNWFAILLWFAAGLAWYVRWSANDPSMANITYAIIGVIFFNAFFAFLQEYRAEKAFEALEKMIPHDAFVIRDGEETKISAKFIVVGDLIVLKEGMNVPADARLIKSVDLAVDNSALTGESEPKPRKEEPEEEGEDHANIVYSGTTVTRGHGTGVVFATGASTEFGKIAHLSQEVGEAPTPLQREITYVIRINTIISIIFGVTFFFAGRAIGIDTNHSFIFAIGIIAANIPEGLLPTVTLSLSMGTQRMAKKNAIIKRLSSIETLGSATVICTDKTGTITLNKMSLEHVYIANKSIDAKKAKPGEMALAAILCNNAKIDKEKVTGDPTETALMRWGKKIMGDESEGWERIDEIAFSSERKMMSTVNKKKDITMLYTKGAPEVVLEKCKQIAQEKDVVALNDKDKKKIEDKISDYAGKGMRVMAFAEKKLKGKYSKENLEEDLVFLGLGALRDPPRPDVPDAVKECKRAGLKIIIITGDNPLTAKAIASDVGISDNPQVITGKELEKMKKKELEKVLEKEVIFARSSPEHKLKIVQALKDMGETVAVTGDGVNDAPALKEADIGVAMGKGGTDVARESADMILIDDNFATIVSAIKEGRAVFDNIRRFITYIFSHLLPEMLPFILFVLFKIPLPLTVIQLLSIDLGTDMGPAIALGAEKPEPDVMDRKPRPRGERILTVPMLLKSYMFLGLFEAFASSVVAFFYVLSKGGWSFGTNLAATDPLYLKATTMTLAAIVVIQRANSFTCRTTRESLFKAGVFTNKYLLIGIGISITIIMLIVYAPPAQRIFGTAPLDVSDWIILLPMAAFLLGADEFRKWIIRRRNA